MAAKTIQTTAKSHLGLKTAISLDKKPSLETYQLAETIKMVTRHSSQDILLLGGP